MNIFSFVKQSIRKFFFNFFSLKISFNKRNINKNLETPNIEIVNYLQKSVGVLHLGAHRGSERFVYDWFGKRVVWIEANPSIYVNLKQNLSEFKFQNCYLALLHSHSKENLKFYLSSNDNASSSIFDFTTKFKNKEIFFQNKKRDIKMTDFIKLETITLDDLVSKHNIDLNQYSHWVIDVQGSELELFKGAVNSLKLCKSIVVEVSLEEFYENGAKFNDVKKFLFEQNFKLLLTPNRNHEDVLFVKKNDHLPKKLV